MKNSPRLFVLALRWLALACFGGSLLEAAPVALRFTATTSNAGQGGIVLDDPRLNGKSALKLIVTHDFGSDVAGSLNKTQIAVRYDPDTKRWRIINQNRQVSIGTAGGNRFNVLIGSALRFLPTAMNSGGYGALLPGTKDKPDLRLLITHMENPYPKKTFGNTFERNFGVLNFNTVDGTMWGIGSTDGREVPVSAWNVLDVSKYPNTLVQESSPANVNGNNTMIDHPAANNNPTAVVFVTRTGFSQQDKPVGVYYEGSHWTIYNEDSTGMANGQTFNVTIFSAPTP